MSSLPRVKLWSAVTSVMKFIVFNGNEFESKVLEILRL